MVRRNGKPLNMADTARLTDIHQRAYTMLRQHRQQLLREFQPQGSCEFTQGERGRLWDRNANLSHFLLICLDADLGLVDILGLQIQDMQLESASNLVLVPLFQRGFVGQSVSDREQSYTVGYLVAKVFRL